LPREFRFGFFVILHDSDISKIQGGSQEQHTSLFSSGERNTNSPGSLRFDAIIAGC
jgi:hypothetical protein